MNWKLEMGPQGPVGPKRDGGPSGLYGRGPLRGNWKTRQGVSLGLWVLAGLAFLLRALFPGSTGGTLLAPILLAAAVAVTGIGASRAFKTPISSSGKHRLLAAASAAVLALLVSLTIIREGDRRSWVFVAVTALLVFVLTWRHGHAADQ